MESDSLWLWDSSSVFDRFRMTEYCFDWSEKKGVRGESPNNNSEDCGEYRESQGSPSKAQASRWRKRNENREEIFPASERSEQGLKFPRFVAGVAFHTCAALGGRGESQRPGPLVTFGTKVTLFTILQTTRL